MVAAVPSPAPNPISTRRGANQAPINQSISGTGGVAGIEYIRYFQENDRLMIYLLSQIQQIPVGDVTIYDNGHSDTIFADDVFILNSGDSLGNS